MSENNEGPVIATNALIAKRADVLFEITEAEKRIELLRTELVHLDAVLRMFRPDIQTEALPVRLRRPSKSPYFNHGEVTRRIYDALRPGDAVSSAEIAAIAMRDKGLEPNNDPATRSEFVRLVGVQLSDMHRKGKIERVGRGRALRWRLTPDS